MNFEIDFGKTFSKKFIYQDCLNVDLMLQTTGTPETYPLLHREFQVENWKAAFPDGNLLALWVGHAIALRSFAINSAKKTKARKFFLCLAFSMYNPSDDEYLIPKIYVANRKRMKTILSLSRDITHSKGSSEISKIKSAFKSCGALGSFSFYEDRFKDPSGRGEIIWLYCISSNDVD